ncbi:alpha/beta hydrolase [Georgenia subflava]|uniref:Alpha/beta fold hydrolase n=1 Tax=Georgenia subflava TaxID=1622177 RepID=A0A6N7EM21_9MICO|nr:alpha/beta hydrolase [Georgenia subflava]MPV37575.1 alpha/beta fold hydrolase [Georgenia subflava]
MPASRPARVLVALAAAALTLSACSAEPDRGDDPTVTQVGPDAAPGSSVPAGLEEYYGQELTWEACGDFECAEATVPLDYEAPDGESITLALKRLSSDDDARVGSLLINPGGPGSSALDLVEAAPAMFGADLLAAYDVVGFDPRGVGDSTAIDCVSDAELDRLRSASYDTETDEGLRAYRADSELIADGCAEGSGDLVAHVDTVSAARDMDVLRHLLGEERLDYLGFSYGTFLGATYADLFPEQVGNLVLDGAMDPSLDSHQMTLDQAIGFEEALRAYVADCQAGSECPLTGDVDGGVEQVQTLLELTGDTPLPTASDRDLTASLALSGILLPLYDSTTWFVLTAALEQAMNERDGSQLLFLADLMASREADGTYSSNSTEANWAINCLDHPSTGDLADWEVQADELAEAAPTFGPALSYGGMLCDSWPAEGVDAGALTAAGSAPIMVVGTTGDPATPYQWSVSLAEQLENGFLVTYEGEGHTAYGRSNDCIAGAVEDFLIHGTVPEEGLTC